MIYGLISLVKPFGNKGYSCDDQISLMFHPQFTYMILIYSIYIQISALSANQVYGYDTRNASSFHVPKCRTNELRMN